ncbi:CBF-domain-containing protein [Thozetella sp. PMI_491]|nr:CBF-domain-containing protein [Thozetella sp. PMI_491]
MASKDEKAAKRKRATGEASTLPRKRRAQSQSSDDGSSSSGASEVDGSEEILLLESEIAESKKNYNNIAKLIEISQGQDEDAQRAVVGAVSLCRVFIRLLSAGDLAKAKDAPKKQALVVRQLREWMTDFTKALLSMLRRDESALTSLTLSMRLWKAAADYLGDADTFPADFFKRMVHALLQPGVDGNVRDEFVEKFMGPYDDVRFYTFRAVEYTLPTERTASNEAYIHNAFELVIQMDEIPEAKEDVEDFYREAPKEKHELLSLSRHKRQAQNAWLGIMKLGLTYRQKKKALEVMATAIAPWFPQPELLMDFLTDCYNTGESISLLALSGVFYLMQERNLDYPLFYTKLYSLLDSRILHSKYRSRFLRLLDTFLGSSHLPAVMVASFIKRLARLALNAPPAAIVAVVPWFYNLFKKHPLTTFMMHRAPRTDEEKLLLESEGLADPFLPEEQDPMETRAIESCLWEIVQLQSHYHPNVATIAKIISEQFTKQMYNMEDFLDHSYTSLLEAELGKEIKKPPVVEFKIPKKVFTRLEPGSEERDSPLVRLWDFGS